MNQEQQGEFSVASAVVEEKKGFSLVWLLPLIALAIAGWLVYRSIAEAKLPIQIEFPTSEGIVTGKTEVRYKGFSVGVVDEIKLKETLDGVIVTVMMEREAKDAMNDGTEFWLVKPEITLAGVRGLDTLLSGNYIAIRPGEGKPSKSFVALPEPPPADDSVPGLHLVLHSTKLNSVGVGSPVLYRELQVGEVTDTRLTAQGNSVIIKLLVKEEFSHLVTSNSRFWNTSGVKFSGGLDGFDVEVGSMATIIAGGVAFHNPKLSGPGEPVQSGTEFQLYDRFDEAEVGVDITLYVPNGSGIVPEKTQIKWRGYQVGIVTDVGLMDDRTTLRVSATMDPRAEKAMNSGAQFFVVRPTLELGAIRDVDAIISGPYISVRLGDGEPQREFDVLPRRPPISQEAPGLHLVLETPIETDIQLGAPVTYKGIETGSVQDINLDETGELLRVQIHIKAEYEHLVHQATRFWKAGGVDVKANFRGVFVRTPSLLALLAGGVAFDAPPGAEVENTVQDGQTFELFDSYETAYQDVGREVIDRTKPGIYPILETDVLGGLQIGSPVFHRNIDVGEVIAHKLDDTGEKILVYLRVEPKYAGLLKPQSRFWRSGGVEFTGDLSGFKARTESFLAMLAGGVSFDSPDGASGKISDGHRFVLSKDYQQAHEKGTEISITFDDGIGLKQGTKVKYRGIEVGEVRTVKLDQNLEEVTATVMLFEHASALARADSQWWVVGPTLGLASTENLDTLLTGVYITVEPGSGEKALAFRALQAAPAVAKSGSGLDIVLTTPALNSIKQGNLVFYRKVPVGRVTGFELGEHSDEVLIHLNIQPRYTNLVRSNSKFWNASGFNMDIGIFSATKIRTESMESILEGGIAFATPDQPADPVDAGHRFVLESEENDIWRTWRPKISLSAER